MLSDPKDFDLLMFLSVKMTVFVPTLWGRKMLPSHSLSLSHKPWLSISERWGFSKVSFPTFAKKVLKDSALLCAFSLTFILG